MTLYMQHDFTKLDTDEVTEEIIQETVIRELYEETEYLGNIKLNIVI